PVRDSLAAGRGSASDPRETERRGSAPDPRRNSPEAPSLPARWRPGHPNRTLPRGSVHEREAGAQQVFVAAGAADHDFELARLRHGAAVAADEAQIFGREAEAHGFRLAAL